MVKFKQNRSRLVGFDGGCCENGVAMREATQLVVWRGLGWRIHD